MKSNYEVIELTKENESKYLAGVVELEENVLEKMEKAGKVGQLFITGAEGIHEYVESPSNHVMIAVSDTKGKNVISAAYITKGQVDYTYNDITKYFKCDEKYQEYVKSKYSDESYKRAIREVYTEKICAFRYSRDIILNQKGIRNLSDFSEEKKNLKLLELIEKERNNPQNRFHEKSEIREHLNQYMSLYMKKIKHDSRRYQDFYWVDYDFLRQELGQNDRSLNESTSKYDTTIETYDKILNYQKYKIHDISHCNDMSKYYTANTSNTIELDTYITHPDNREKGIARVLVLEGLKKALKEVAKKSDNSNVFLVSTLHEDNLSSKYVSEFFGLKDYVFVNRRNGRDRQVHIFGMKRKEILDYIEQMEKKIAVLYGYNPSNLKISEDERKGIIKEQIQYEADELKRLNSAKTLEPNKKYTGYIKCKESKIQSLKKLIGDGEQEQITPDFEMDL